jgi:hypothetical protein
MGSSLVEFEDKLCRCITNNRIPRWWSWGPSFPCTMHMPLKGSSKPKTSILKPLFSTFPSPLPCVLLGPPHVKKKYTRYQISYKPQLLSIPDTMWYSRSRHNAHAKVCFQTLDQVFFYVHKQYYMFPSCTVT